MRPPAPDRANDATPAEASETDHGGATEAELVEGTSRLTFATPDVWIEDLLSADPRFSRLLADPAKFRLQIIVSEVDGDRIMTHTYRMDEELFFAASSVKTVASVAALHELAVMAPEGHVDLDTPMAVCRRDAQECDREDESNLDTGMITLGHELRKMHLVSNNRAFNRLYNFVGHARMNEVMWDLGFDSVRIRHRMGQQSTIGRGTPRLEFDGRDGTVIVPRRHSRVKLPEVAVGRALVGIARIGSTGIRHEEPRDFSEKNYISMKDLHRLHVAIVRPEFADSQPLGLLPDHRKALLEAMTEDPLESANPAYDRPRFSGLRYKLMLRGVLRVLPRERIRYVNKPGKAYGFHIENAYVEDVETGRAFFVTAGVYVNENGIINDNVYEYDEISRPFFLDLGEVLARELLAPEVQG